MNGHAFGAERDNTRTELALICFLARLALFSDGCLALFALFLSWFVSMLSFCFGHNSELRLYSSGHSFSYTLSYFLSLFQNSLNNFHSFMGIHQFSQ